MAFVSVVGALRDRDRLPVTVRSVRATDLLQTRNGWLFRSYRDGQDMYVGRSLDAGVTWEPIRVGAGIGKSAPTLARSRWDDLFCWWHDADGIVRAVSEDWGRTWTLRSAVVPLHFPRMAVGAERSYLIGHSTDPVLASPGLALYHTDNFGLDLDPKVTILGVPEQLAALRVSWRGWLHLVYRDAAGRILHRYSDDGGQSLGGQTTLLESGNFPSYALGIDRALLAVRDGSTLALYQTDETFRGGLQPVPAPTAAFAGGYVGLLVDLAGQAWLSHLATGSQQAQWSGGLLDWRDPR